MRRAIFIIVFLAIFMGGCSGRNEQVLNEQILRMQQQIDQYQQDSSKQKAEIAELKEKYAESQALFNEKTIRMKRAGGLCYIGLTDKEQVRFVEKEIDLRALPFDDAPGINLIRENTLVYVYDKVSNTGDYDNEETLWYYVSIPVHDTPMDYKGWIKYTETLLYDSDTQKRLQGDVFIRIGAKYAETSELPDFSDKSLVRICDRDIGGRISRKQGDYVYMEGSGGSIYWVHKQDIVYPDIP